MNTRDMPVVHKMVVDAFLGIDLGTTNSAAAIYRNDRNETTMVPLEEGGFILPSNVEYKVDGHVVVGRKHMEVEAVLEGNVVTNMKRIIGRKYDDEEVQLFGVTCKAAVVKGPHGFASFRIPALKNKILLPEEVCSEIVRVLYNRALTTLEDRYKLKCLAISVPAYFNQDQRVATVNAVKFAGITLPVYVVNEPSAAALAFSIQNEVESGNIVTYDLGGGTFDVTVMKVRNGNQFEVLASSGINTIGGENFDECILKYSVDVYRKEVKDGLLPSTKDPKYYRALCGLQETCRESKEALNVRGDMVEIEAGEYIKKYILTKGQIVLVEVCDPQLTMNTFNELIRKDINMTLDKLNQCIEEAGLTKEDITKVVFVGGSSRLRLVKDELKKLFGDRISKAVNPDECVSSGAAVYAYQIERGILDVIDGAKYNIYTCPGARRKENYRVFIPKGSFLPVSKEKIFRTCEDHIGSCKDELYEGKTEEDAHQLAAMRVDGITEYDDGHAVELRYKISISEGGILSYSVSEVESGRVLVEDKIIGYGKLRVC